MSSVHSLDKHRPPGGCHTSAPSEKAKDARALADNCFRDLRISELRNALSLHEGRARHRQMVGHCHTDEVGSEPNRTGAAVCQPTALAGVDDIVHIARGSVQPALRTRSKGAANKLGGT